ncbi:hypothetical protein ACFVXC_00040 [Streptomyces sp. NPDC058257]|uniref:hypothetical protein n=1 Tax=Streptomyces sp. NPDC058257 TaxID=3346409 RepID=UPI0036EDBB6A
MSSVFARMRLLPMIETGRRSRYWRCANPLALLREYAEHYTEHRPHQSRRQLPPAHPMQLPPAHPLQLASATNLDPQHNRRRRVLGGLINEYQQVA